MKHRFFDKGIYLEGLKQLRAVGFLSMAIFLLEAIIIPINFYNRCAVMTDSQKYITLVSSYNMHPILTASCFILAPVMTFLLFRFLNKRNKSDFYHSLPHSRTCIFTALTAAILTWILAIILLSSAVSMLILSFMGKYLAVIWSDYLLSVAGFIVASIYVVAAIALAMSITGTVFTNVIVAGGILFLPRYLLYLFNITVFDALPMLSEQGTPWLLNYKINLVAGTAMDFALGKFFYNENPFSSFSNVPAILYTGILALLLLAAALVLFHKRSSEFAGRAVPNKYLHTLYRSAVAFVFYALITAYMMTNILKKNEFNGWSYALFAVFGLVIYLLYEMITQRSAKTLLKTLPSFLIVLFLSGVYALGIYGFYQSALSIRPAQNEISSVSVLGQDQPNYIYQSNQMSFVDYVQSRAKDIQITDETAKEIISKTLAQNLDDYQEKGYQKFIEQAFSSAGAAGLRYQAVVVKIDTGASSTYRRLYMTQEDYSVLNKRLMKNESYKNLWVSLPDAINETVFLNFDTDRTPDLSMELFNSFKEEINTVDKDAWRNVLTESGSGSNLYLSYIVANGESQGMSINNIPIDYNLFPKTAQLYFDRIAPIQASERKEARNIIDSLNLSDTDKKGESSSDNGYMFTTLHVYNSQTKSYEERLLTSVEEIENLLNRHTAEHPVNIQKHEPFIILETRNDTIGSFAKCTLPLTGLSESEVENLTYQK